MLILYLLENINLFLKMSKEKEEKEKKFKLKFKNIYDQKILSAIWEREGMEVSFAKLNYFIIINKDNFQKG